MLNGFKAAAEVGPYDEFPVLVAGLDPQVYLSRNDRPQPFYLVCEKDSLLVQMAGTGRLLLKYGPVLWESMRPGDFVYVPAFFFFGQVQWLWLSERRNLMRPHTHKQPSIRQLVGHFSC